LRRQTCAAQKRCWRGFRPGKFDPWRWPVPPGAVSAPGAASDPCHRPRCGVKRAPHPPVLRNITQRRAAGICVGTLPRPLQRVFQHRRVLSELRARGARHAFHMPGTCRAILKTDGFSQDAVVPARQGGSAFVCAYGLRTVQGENGSTATGQRRLS
jgi:hypothetical protein